MATPSPRPDRTAEAHPWRVDSICTFGDRAGEALAESLPVPLVHINVHRFPDNEARVRVADSSRLHGCHVGLYRSLNDPDAKLIELLLTASALRDAGARRLTLIAPYLCYMRQDIAFNPGEAVSQRVIGGLLAQAFDSFVTVDPHLHRTAHLSTVFEGKPALALTAAPALAAFLRNRRLPQGTLLVGPDEESAPLVRAVAAGLGTAWAVCQKTRDTDRSVRIDLPAGEKFARPVVVVDDVISTGATIAALAEALVNAGARPALACTVHALFDDDDEATMREAGVPEIVSCNGVTHPSNAISLVSVIASAVAPSAHEQME